MIPDTWRTEIYSQLPIDLEGRRSTRFCRDPCPASNNERLESIRTIAHAAEYERGSHGVPRRRVLHSLPAGSRPRDPVPIYLALGRMVLIPLGDASRRRLLLLGRPEDSYTGAKAREVKDAPCERSSE